MTINANIPLQVQSPDTGKGIMQIGQIMRQNTRDQQAIKESNTRTETNQKRGKVLDAQLQGIEAEEAKRQFVSIVEGAASIHDDLAAGRLEQAKAILLERRDQLVANGRNTTDTDEAIKAIDENPQELLTSVQAIMKEGMSRGVLENTETKSDIIVSSDAEEFKDLNIPEGNATVTVTKDRFGNITNSSIKSLHADDKPDPQTNLAKINQDEQNGLISPEEATTLKEIAGSEPLVKVVDGEVLRWMKRSQAAGMEIPDEEKEGAMPTISPPSSNEVDQALDLIDSIDDFANVENKDQLAWAIASEARTLMKTQGVGAFDAQRTVAESVKLKIEKGGDPEEWFGWEWTKGIPGRSHQPDKFNPDLITAINPNTGEKMKFENGQWVPFEDK